MPSRDPTRLTEALFHAAAAGDEAAQTALYEECLPIIKRAIARRREELGETTRDEPADVAQDIAIHLLGELSKHEWQSEKSFFGWVKLMAHAKLIDAHRRARAAKRDVALETRFDSEDALPRKGGDGVETTVEKVRLRKELDALLSEMDERYAKALRMEATGYTHAEIAAEIGSPSEDAARKTLDRAHAKLNKLRKKKR